MLVAIVIVSVLLIAFLTALIERFLDVLGNVFNLFYLI